MKNIYELIETRRTVHTYEPQSIDPALLENIVRAGHFAPNHKLTWPWRFTWLGQETRHQLTALAVEVKERMAPLADAQRQKLNAKVQNPAHLEAIKKGSDKMLMIYNDASIARRIPNLRLSGFNKSPWICSS